MDIPPSPASDLMTLTHVPSEIYLRMLLRKCFSSFERYMDFVLKSVAKLHSAWTADDTWLQELQSCVGITTRAQMRRDSEWDTYIICEVLKKLLVQVYLAHSTCRDDDETEMLRNSVHQVAYTRQLISHNLRPSYVEIVSCAFAALDICKAFPLGKNDLYQSTVAELEALADSAKVVIQLTLGASEIRSVQRHELCQMALDSVLREAEALLNDRIIITNATVGKPIDIQAALKLMENRPSPGQLKGKLRQRSEHKTKAHKIEISAAQIEEAVSDSQRSATRSVLDSAISLGFITEVQAQSVIYDAGHGKNPKLKKWKVYDSWNRTQISEAFGHFRAIMKGRNALNHGAITTGGLKHITPELSVEVINGCIGLLLLLQEDESPFFALRTELTELQRNADPAPLEVSIFGIDDESKYTRIQFETEKELHGRKDVIQRLQSKIKGNKSFQVENAILLFLFHCPRMLDIIILALALAQTRTLSQTRTLTLAISRT